MDERLVAAGQAGLWTCIGPTLDEDYERVARAVLEALGIDWTGEEWQVVAVEHGRTKVTCSADNDEEARFIAGNWRRADTLSNVAIQRRPVINVAWQPVEQEGTS